MNRKVLRASLLVASATFAILWATGRVENPFLPFVALMLFFLGANLFGRASEFSDKMRPLFGNHARVQVWGSPLPNDGSTDFVVHTVRALGPGLHLYLRLTPNGSPKHLKIAQPIGAKISPGIVEIKDAKYVQWDGKTLKKVQGEPALKLTLQT